LSRSVLAWALGRALRLAVGTCVVALLLATTLSGLAAERLATTAYLAAIFAAFTLAMGRFIPFSPEERRAVTPPFPAFLGYSFAIAIFVSVMAMLVSQAGAEALALLAAVGLIVTAVLVRSGALRTFNATLSRGGSLVAASRYAAVAIIAGLALAAVVGSDDSLVTFAFRFMVLATILIAASLLARTQAGLWVQQRYSNAIEQLDRLERAFVFERTAAYAAIAAVAAMIVAGIFSQAYGDAFGVVAYLAAATAALGVAMECRRLRS
jgi:hypothetical protein